MRALRVVEVEILRQLLFRIADAFVGMKINVVILHHPPQPFDEHIVDPAALAVHADADAIVLEDAGEFCTGELTPLVGVEDLRFAILGDHLFECLNAEVRILVG